MYFFFFFFSSRRRHTRLQGDWSSDVCSSDLFRFAELRPVQLPVVGLSEKRNADKLSVGGIAPAVVGTREDWGVSLVVTAHFHPTMPAGVQEHVQALLAVAAQDHRFLAHARYEVVTRLRDLTFVTHEQPGSSEHPFQLFRVDLFVDEDLAADQSRPQIHETAPVTTPRRHGFS